MARVGARGLEFEYDQFGSPSGEPLLLVMGLGAQMISWDEGLCELLVRKAFHVTRYDNRDVGLSSRLDQLGVPDVMAVAAGQVPPAYTIEDLADDAAGVMDALGIASAHVVGASMGGFIVQALAIRHPERVRTLTSIMSAPGQTSPPTPEAMAVLLEAPAKERDALIAQGVASSRVLWGDYFTEERALAKRTAAVDRAVSVEGTARQFGACLAQASRVDQLGRLRVPALVVHGDADPLVPYEDGVRTAEAIPGARLLTLHRVGHDLPPARWEEVASAIADLAGLGSGAAR